MTLGDQMPHKKAKKERIPVTAWMWLLFWFNGFLSLIFTFLFVIETDNELTMIYSKMSMLCSVIYIFSTWEMNRQRYGSIYDGKYYENTITPIENLVEDNDDD